MSNPVVVEVLRGDRVEFDPSRVGGGGRRRRAGCARLRRRRRTRLSALGGEGDSGAAADRERRGRPSGP